jgi:septum formation inhibitor MinC
MKKGKTNLLIPVFVILSLIFILGFVLLREDVLDFLTPYPYAMKRIEGYPKNIKSNKVIEKTRNLITSKEDYDKLVAELFDNPAEIPMPAVDFSTNKILLVTSKTNDTTGYKIKIESVIKNEQEQKLETIIRNSKPGETCVNTEEKNVSVDMVLLDNDSFDLKFDKVDRTEECK